MQLSAFVDGELPENEKELLLRRMSQDADLRQQVAEYLAIGRAMRGEVQLAGIDTLRMRVARGIDDDLVQDPPLDAESGSDRRLRPLAGFAIAATVALAAIFGLRQMYGVEDIAAPVTTAGDPAFPTQPPVDDFLRQRLMRHEAAASQNGANSINTRLSSFELGQEIVIDPEFENEPGAGDEADLETAAGEAQVAADDEPDDEAAVESETSDTVQ